MSTTNSPTIAVAEAHIQAQGISTKGATGALTALFSPAQANDDLALERQIILSSEMIQHALNTARNGIPQIVTFGPLMLNVLINTASELTALMGVLNV